MIPLAAERIFMTGTLAIMSGVVWLIDQPAALLCSAVTLAFIAMWTLEEWP